MQQPLARSVPPRSSQLPAAAPASMLLLLQLLVLAAHLGKTSTHRECAVAQYGPGIVLLCGSARRLPDLSLQPIAASSCCGSSHAELARPCGDAHPQVVSRRPVLILGPALMELAAAGAAPSCRAATRQGPASAVAPPPQRRLPGAATAACPRLAPVECCCCVPKRRAVIKLAGAALLCAACSQC